MNRGWARYSRLTELKRRPFQQKGRYFWLSIFLGLVPFLLFRIGVFYAVTFPVAKQPTSRINVGRSNATRFDQGLPTLRERSNIRHNEAVWKEDQDFLQNDKDNGGRKVQVFKLKGEQQEDDARYNRITGHLDNFGLHDVDSSATMARMDRDAKEFVPGVDGAFFEARVIEERVNDAKDLERESEEFERKEDKDRKLKEEAEHKLKEEEEHKLKVEEERKLKEKEERKLKEEDERKLKVEDEHKLKEEEKRKLKEEEERKRGVDEERRRAEEEARKRGEERKLKAEEERKLKEEEKRKLKVEEERKLKEEAKRKLQEEGERKLKEEEERKLKEKRKLEEEERRLKEEEERKLKDEDERKLKEEKRKLKEEKERKLEEEKERKLKEEEERKLKEEKRKLNEEEERKLTKEDERKLKEEEERKLKKEDERKLKEEGEHELKEEEERKLKEEEERRRVVDEECNEGEEEARKREERKLKAEKERKLKEAEERKSGEDGERKKGEEEARKRGEEERKLKEEEERKLKEEEERKLKEEGEHKLKEEEERKLKDEQERKKAEEGTRKREEERRQKGTAELERKEEPFNTEERDEEEQPKRKDGDVNGKEATQENASQTRKDGEIAGVKENSRQGSDPSPIIEVITAIDAKTWEGGDATKTKEAQHTTHKFSNMETKLANKTQEEDSKPAEVVSTGVEKWNSGPGDCDLYDGVWEYDEADPLYTNDTCPYMQRDQNCLANGRPDRMYLHWRWKPRGCDLPRFDAEAFMQVFKGKTVGFVGDSLARNQMQSLLCMLTQVEKPILLYDADYTAKYSFEQHQLNLLVVWAPYLVKHSDESVDGYDLPSVLHMDVLDLAWTSRIDEMDIMIVSVGQWFFKAMLYVEKEGKDVLGCYQCAHLNVTDIGFLNIFRESLRQGLEKIASEMKGIVVLTTFGVQHYEHGPWNTGWCRRERPLTAEEAPGFGWMNNEMRGVVLDEFTRIRDKRGQVDKALSFDFIDITRVNLLRADAHPGPYRRSYPYAHRNSSEWVQNDCLHWCMPGPVDTWNQLLFKVALRYL